MGHESLLSTERAPQVAVLPLDVWTASSGLQRSLGHSFSGTAKYMAESETRTVAIEGDGLN